MAVQEVQAYVYICDGCKTKVLSTDADVVDGITGVLTEKKDDNARTLLFFACRKTHVAKAVKNVLVAASGESARPWSGQTPDPTGTDTQPPAESGGTTPAIADGGESNTSSQTPESSPEQAMEGDDTAESAKPSRRRGQR